MPGSSTTCPFVMTPFTVGEGERPLGGLKGLEEDDQVAGLAASEGSGHDRIAKKG